MMHEKGDMLTRNRGAFKNAPNGSSAAFFLSGDHRANEHPVLAALHVLLSHEHNRLAAEIVDAFPGWSDERLFQLARLINVAQFQRVVFDEFYPTMTARHMPAYCGYRAQVNPAPSVIFTSAAFRIGHSMVPDVLHVARPVGRHTLVG